MSNYKYKPDLEFIKKLEENWETKKIIDYPYGISQEGKCVSDLTKLLHEEGDSEIARYIESKFDLDEALCNHHYNGRETIESMRKGTPFGILAYMILYALPPEDF